MEAIIPLFLLVGLAFSFFGGKIWEGKGGSFAAGFFITLFLGLLGLVIVLVVNPGSQAIAPSRGPRATRECPSCKELMRRDASVCPHCRRESEPWRYEGGYWWVHRDNGFHYLDERTGTWVRHEQADA